MITTIRMQREVQVSRPEARDLGVGPKRRHHLHALGSDAQLLACIYFRGAPVNHPLVCMRNLAIVFEVRAGTRGRGSAGSCEHRGSMMVSAGSCEHRGSMMVLILFLLLLPCSVFCSRVRALSRSASPEGSQGVCRKFSRTQRRRVIAGGMVTTLELFRQRIP